ncbi:MAG: hypothetical protein ACRD3E_07955 [Terriglobales bacterium]
MDVAELGHALEDFLADHPRVTVAEEDEVVFTLPGARYSISGDGGKALLHLWSAERNFVRRVLELKPRVNELTLKVQRFGQARPSVLHVLAEGERSSPGSRAAERASHRHLLKRVLEREFPDYHAGRFTSAMDLEKSFGPVYARGVLHRGQSALAVLGVCDAEPQPSVDAALTTALLWLGAVRETTRQWTEGLVLVIPAGRSAVIRARLAWLARGAGRIRLFELEERETSLVEMDASDGGNIQTRLVHRSDDAAVEVRFSEPIAKICTLLPDCELHAPSAAELVFRYRGLEFARSHVVTGNGFRRVIETTFGIGPEETPLSEETEPQLASLVERVRNGRQSLPCARDPLWRVAPERWLESLVVRDVAAIDRRLDPRFVYSQVPAFSAGDRAMIDVLTCTRDGRLAVLELKASEDLHLPLQGLDYWARVRWHNERGEFQRFGYFAGREISKTSPLLFLVTPALHLHPECETLLKYLAQEVEWEIVAVDERWREKLSVVFRKHA